jgi:hypothetical protein
MTHVNLITQLTARAAKAIAPQGKGAMSGFTVAGTHLIPQVGDFVCRSISDLDVPLLVVRREFEYLPQIVTVRLTLDLED